MSPTPRVTTCCTCDTVDAKRFICSKQTYFTGTAQGRVLSRALFRFEVHILVLGRYSQLITVLCLLYIL
jgi:hypothetical protein